MPGLLRRPLLLSASLKMVMSAEACHGLTCPYLLLLLLLLVFCFRSACLEV
jgi:hypothetical protein